MKEHRLRRVSADLGPRRSQRARPDFCHGLLAGVWSTAPYLHNGSVPTLADMLTPPEQRPPTFMVGTREYDPQKMGYRMAAADSTFRFDTSVKGNSNAGHPFGTKLTPEEKQDLMEFLKRLGRTS